MCLILKKDKPKTAKDDVICYKVLVKRSFDTVKTPYTKTNVRSEILSGKEDFCAFSFNNSGMPIVMKRADNKYQIDGGVIHTYAKEKIAINDARWLRKTVGEERVIIYECRIPKGCEYYEGETPVAITVFDNLKAFNGCKSYASPRIRFVKKIWDSDLNAND